MDWRVKKKLKIRRIFKWFVALSAQLQHAARISFTAMPEVERSCAA